MSKQTAWKDPSNQIRLVGDMNRFAFRLFERVCEGNAENLFLSPSSISTALAMALAGAGGQTREELADALGFSLPEDRLHHAFRDLSENTRTGGVEFRSANRLWGQRSYHFLEDFLRTTQEYYGARLAEVDFQAPEAARRLINSWIAEQTADRIPDLVPPGCLDPLTRLIITNAVYFLGSWETEFDENDTSESDFFGAAGGTSRVSMMHQTESFNYGQCESYEILEMPYKRHGIEMYTVEHRGEKYEQVRPVREEGSSFALMVILPRLETELNAVVQQLTVNGLQSMPRCDQRAVHVFLPRFQMDSAFSLGDTLQSLGVRRAFSFEDADFSRMSDDPEGLYIAEVLHKAFVEVNEKGTEAAAATAISLLLGCYGPPPPPVEFRADRPFLFMIRDTLTGLIHFVGRYMGP